MKRKPKARIYPPLAKLERAATRLRNLINDDKLAMKPMVERIEQNEAQLRQFNASIAAIQDMMKMRDD